MNDKTPEPQIKYETLGLPRLLVVLTTIAVSGWYMWWRLSTFNPDAKAFSYLLYGCEWFGISTLLLHFFMVRRLTIREAPLPEPGLSVDIFIPTINETIDVVRRTVVNAISMDYPHTTYILDDGRREEMRKLAEELGCKYLARETNEDAKAGNLNYGLAHSTGEFIAIFDADHAPKPTFLTRTLGYFRDAGVAFVQTPQDFYNLDSYQHRVERSTGRIWTEQSLFFRVIQRGKDYWNSAFFCGSCAIIRRSALDAIGGIATGTVTEDLHTSIRLHKYGFKSVYHSESLALGIAPAHIEPFLKQRIRWGQGAMQVWRKEGVVFNRHLTLAQKLNYIASMIIYFDGWQKGIYYITPVVVLLTGMMPLVTTMSDFLWHFIPFFIMSIWCFEELGRGYGEMLFVEQYNMARFAAFSYSTLGLFMGNLKFRVTNKRMTSSLSNYWFLMPQYAVFILNMLAIPIGFILYETTGHLAFYSLLANMVWSMLNLALSAMVLLFSLRRSRFKRNNYRFSIPLVARLTTKSGEEIFASIDDLSCAGMFIVTPRELQLKKNDSFTGTLFLPDGPLSFDAVVKSLHFSGKNVETLDGLGCEFVWNNDTARQRMERFLYGSDLEWHLHNLSEINFTPLAGVSTKEHKVIALPAWHKTKNSQITSMVLNPKDHSLGAMHTGIINMDPRTQRGTMLVFKPLPENGTGADAMIDTMLLTNKGWQNIRTKVANQNKPDPALPNMYLYQLESVSA